MLRERESDINDYLRTIRYNCLCKFFGLILINIVFMYIIVTYKNDIIYHNIGPIWRIMLYFFLGLIDILFLLYFISNLDFLQRNMYPEISEV